MIEREWIDGLKNGGIENEFVSVRDNIVNGFRLCYENLEADDE